jgi:lipoate-protein ligase A
MENFSTLPYATWRLLDTGESDGTTNMAVDEAIMYAVRKKKSPPTLRFYGWSPPCVSIGYMQSIDEIDLEICREKGYSLVRRLTGGRAVLHIDELTYSVIASQKEAQVAGDILTSYQRLSLGLVKGLQILGCNVTQSDRFNSLKQGSSACFEIPSHYEVKSYGRKLIGSAQVRRNGVVLQHGAIPLKGDVSRLIDVLSISELDKDNLREKLLKRAIALDEAMRRNVTYDELVKVIVKGFEQALNLNFETEMLSDYEKVEAGKLKLKYLDDEWTHRK